MGELFLQWIMFLLLMALGQFSPGPDMILLTRVALADGLKAGCLVASGIATGLMVHAGVALLLIGQLNKRSIDGSGDWIMSSVTVLAMLYLLWLAYQLMQSAFVGYYSGAKLVLGVDKVIKATCNMRHYRQGLLCNLLNPKVALFLAGVVLPFQQMAVGSTSWLLVLWLTIVLEGFLLWCVWVKLLQARVIKHWYEKNFYWVDGLFGLALVCLVFVLVLEVV